MARGGRLHGRLLLDAGGVRSESGVTRTTTGVVLVDDAGRVLMQLRDDIPTIVDPGCWVNPGGVIDPGELPEEGARREVLEETGYRAGRLVFAYERVLDRPEGYAERQYYFVGRYDGVQPLTCYEGQELRFSSRLRSRASRPRRTWPRSSSTSWNGRRHQSLTTASLRCSRRRLPYREELVPARRVEQAPGQCM